MDLTATAADSSRPAPAGTPHRPPPTSYRALCLGLGLLGILLPVVLLLGEAFLLHGSIGARGSMSAYYHSGMRDVFVGALVSEGLLLATYHLAGDRLQNVLTTLAGVAAVTVACFPTGLPAGCEPATRANPVCGLGPTQLQQALGERPVSIVHGTSAAVLFTLLGVMCALFARHARGIAAGAARIHRLCAAVILVSLVLLIGCKLAHAFDGWATLVAEAVMSAAFGGSWLAQGIDPAWPRRDG